MKVFYLILSALIGCTCVNAASKQVFKVNNTLAQMDVEREVDQYVTILDQLAEDIKNGGMVFGGVLKSMLTLNEAIIDVKEG